MILRTRGRIEEPSNCIISSGKFRKIESLEPLNFLSLVNRDSRFDTIKSIDSRYYYSNDIALSVSAGSTRIGDLQDRAVLQERTTPVWGTSKP